MKYTLIAVLMLAGGSLFAQTNPYNVTDDLVKNKEEMLGKFIPMNGKQFLFAAYAIEPASFLDKLDAFRKSLQPSINAEKNKTIRELKTKDLDYYTRNLLKDYMMDYGLDSLGLMHFNKVLEAKMGAPDFGEAIDSAARKMHQKRLSKEEKATLNEKIMQGGSPSETALFRRSAAYRQWMDEYISELRYTKYKSDTTLAYEGQYLVKLRVVTKEITDPFIKEYLSYYLAAGALKVVKSEAGRQEAYQTFMSLASNEAAQKGLQDVLDNNKMIESNAMSPEFTYVSIDNKKVSLKDLRGKYVYIDVWATWCGPCKAEIPHLQKVEHDYHGKNIQFVSLSVDRQADKPKWEKYVREHNLGGIQLIADKDLESDFIRKYNIAAIPRFILIDPAGRIVSGNALRPSDPGLREMLDKLL